MANKYVIDYQGLSLGEHEFSFDFSDDLFAIWPESPIQKGSGEVDIVLVRHANFLELDVILDGVVSVECDRCCDLYSQDVHHHGEVVVKFSDSIDPEQNDGDVMWISQNDKLDLGQWLYESVILALPVGRMHADRQDCNPEVLKYIN